MWLSPDPATNAVAIVAGAGRSVWQAGRSVEVCRFPAAPQCRAVPIPAGTVSLYPQWGPAGDLLYSTAAAGGPLGAGPGNPSYGATAMAAWDSTFRLWRVPSASVNNGAAPAASQPGSILASSGSPGNDLLVVRDDALWIQSGSGASGGPASPVRVAGPLFSAAAPAGYYGEVDWAATFAWSRAPGPRWGTDDALSAETDPAEKP